MFQAISEIEPIFRRLVVDEAENIHLLITICSLFLFFYFLETCLGGEAANESQPASFLFFVNTCILVLRG